MKPVVWVGLLFVVGINALTAQTEPWARDVYVNGDENQPTLKLLLSDFSGDNRLDIISAEKAWSVYGSAAFKISYRPNTQNGNEYGFFPNYANLKYYLAQNIDYTFMDMDTISAIAGGVQELAVGYRQVTGGVTSHKVDILMKSGSALSVYYTITLPAGSSDIKLVRTGSFDGVADVTTQLSDLAVTSGDKVYIYKNNGPSLSCKFGRTDPGFEGQPNFTIQTSGMGTVEGINTGEFYNSGYAYDQNEGYNEILLTDGSNRIRRWKNNTPEAGANWFVQFAGDPIVNPAVSYGLDYSSRPLFAADMNNDGIQDFIAKPGIRINTSGNPFSWPGNSQYQIYNINEGYYPHANNLALADFNNDGKTDIVAGFIANINGFSWEIPFICFNDGANHLPDDYADVNFRSVFWEDYDIPNLGMLFLTGDISNKGAVSIIRLSHVDGMPWHYSCKKIVVYRRTDNPVPAPPRMKNLQSLGNQGIRVNWYRHPEADVVGYEIWRGFGNGTPPPSGYQLLAEVSGTTYVDAECVLRPNSEEKVYYKIRAKDSQNQRSGYSEALSAGYGIGYGKMSDGEKKGEWNLELHQNYPNPFNPVTRIGYELPERMSVKLEVYNAFGQRVRVLVNEVQDKGKQEVFWNGTDEQGQAVASGMYLYRLQFGGKTLSKRMMLMK